MAQNKDLPTLKIEKAFPDAEIGVRQHPTDSCIDLHAYRFDKLFRQGEPIEKEDGIPIQELDSITLEPLDRVLINTGIKATVAPGYEIQIRSRSSLPLKQGLIVGNGIGTIDEQYRGVLGVCLINVSGKEEVINVGERIAQLAVLPILLPKIEKVEGLEETERGEGGFGSTGK